MAATSKQIHQSAANLTLVGNHLMELCKHSILAGGRPRVRFINILEERSALSADNIT
jgi:hypothetical protein